jgi:hypothetical protein
VSSIVDIVSTLDEPIDRLYDEIRAVARRAMEVERDYRALAERDDLAVDTLGVATTPAECIAQITDELTALRNHLDAAEAARADAKQAAARLSLERGV